MRDPASIRTKHGTSAIVVASRIGFALYLIFIFVAISRNWFPQSYLSVYWLAYLVLIYVLAEKVYGVFLKRNIDLTFGFPLLFAVYLLHLVSLIMRGQEQIPLMNRVEHFGSFILLTYIVWVFFLKYLPHEVWDEHPYYTALLVLSITSFAGVGNEIVELIMDTFFSLRTVGTKYDTSIDLLMNTLGSVLLLSVQLIWIEKEKMKKENRKMKNEKRTLRLGSGPRFAQRN